MKNPKSPFARPDITEVHDDPDTTSSFKIIGDSNDTSAAVAQLIASDNPIAQSYGRLLATGMVETAADYLASELDRGVSIGTVLGALMEFFQSTYVSAGISCLPEKADEALCGYFIEHASDITGRIKAFRESRDQEGWDSGPEDFEGEGYS